MALHCRYLIRRTFYAQLFVYGYWLSGQLNIDATNNIDEGNIKRL